MATATFYPDANPESTSVDGYVERTGVSETWGTITTGAGNNSSDLDSNAIMIFINAAGTTNQWDTLRRSIFLFDTSSLGSSAVVSGAVLSLYGSSKVDSLAVTPNIDIYTSTPASNTSLANADYGQTGSTSQTGSPITYAGWSTTGYNDFTFNATGIGNVSTTGVSKFAARNANYDVANSAPTWSASAGSRLAGFFAEQTGTSNDPKLLVTYTTASTLDVIIGGGGIVAFSR